MQATPDGRKWGTDHGEEADGDHDERRDGQDDQRQLPAVDEAHHQTRHERGQELEQHGQLVADAVLDLVHVTTTDKHKTLFRLVTSAPIWRRKTRRAGFGTHVSQSEHSDRLRNGVTTAACVVIRSIIRRC